MNEDEVILLYSFIGYWMVLGILIYKSTEKLKTGIIHVAIHLAYSAYFLYGLFYDSENGKALGWFVYLLLFIGIHAIINIGQIFYGISRVRKK